MYCVPGLCGPVLIDRTPILVYAPGKCSYASRAGGQCQMKLAKPPLAWKLPAQALGNQVELPFYSFLSQTVPIGVIHPDPAVPLFYDVSPCSLKLK